MHVAIGIQDGAIVWGLPGASGKLSGRRLQKKATKHDKILILEESKRNIIADSVSASLTGDKISGETFRAKLSEVDKCNQMKKEIHGRQIQGIGLSEAEKKELIQRWREEAMTTACTKLLEELKAGTSL